MASRSAAWITLCTGLALALVTGAATAAPAAGVLSFSGVRASSLPQAEYDSGILTFTQQTVKSDSTVAASAIDSGNSRAQSLLGTNRVEVINLTPVDDEDLRRNSVGGPFAVAVSAWFDTFTVTGGSGSATAAVSSSITGQFGNGYGGAGVYRLFKATPRELDGLIADPFGALLYETLPAPVLALDQSVIDTSRFIEDGELLEPGSAFGRTLVGQVDFVYGEPFVLVSVLAGFANDSGSLSSFNSAIFGISAPAATSFSTASDFAYAAAVPEPAMVLLFAMGLPVLWRWRCAGAGAVSRRGRGD